MPPRHFEAAWRTSSGFSASTDSISCAANWCHQFAEASNSSRVCWTISSSCVRRLCSTTLHRAHASLRPHRQDHRFDSRRRLFSIDPKRLKFRIENRGYFQGSTIAPHSMPRLRVALADPMAASDNERSPRSRPVSLQITGNHLRGNTSRRNLDTICLFFRFFSPVHPRIDSRELHTLQLSCSTLGQLSI